MLQVVLVDEKTREETVCGDVGPWDAWWSVPLPPCPSCNGLVEWAEWGQVPGARRCADCNRFYRLKTKMSSDYPGKTGVLPTFDRCIVCGSGISELDVALHGHKCRHCTAKGDKR